MTTTTESQKINYGDPLFFSMYTDEGNLLVFQELSKILSRTNFHGTLKRPDLVAAIYQLEDTVLNAGHREVTDTEVRMSIARWMNEYVIVPNGWVQLDYFYEDLA